MPEKVLLQLNDEILAGQVGQKAFQLHYLYTRQFQVPKAVIVPVAIMQQALVPYKQAIQVTLTNLKAQVKTPIDAAAEIAELLKDIELPEKVIDSIHTALEKDFPITALFAIRSSSNQEDGSEASFAGQFSTTLFVERKKVIAAIIDCWKSTFTATVLAYAQVQAIDLDALLSAVIIQEMVDADYSGVLFSANPQGLLNELVFVIGEKTGDNIVEDKVPVTTFYVNKTDRQHYFIQQAGAPEVTATQLEALVELEAELAQLYDYPIDVEFSFKAGTLYILQVRPITTLTKQAITVLDNSNIVESYPGISLPLTQSFVKYVYYAVFKGLASRCLPNDDIVKKNDGVLQEMVTSVNGRMYYKISNWYQVLSYLPFSKKIIPVWQRMLGVDDTSVPQALPKGKLSEKLQTNGKIIKNAFFIPRKMQQLQTEFEQTQVYFDEHFSQELSNKELISLYEILKKQILENWDITLLNDLYAFIFTGLVEKVVEQAVVETPQKIANQMISGVNKIESLEPMELLLLLVSEVKQTPALFADLEAIVSSLKTIEALAKYPQFNQQFFTYLRLFGDRGLEELKLETITYRTNPEKLVAMIITYAKREQPVILTNVADNTKQTELKLSWWQSKQVAYFSKKARTGIAYRESSRLNRSRIFGMVRSIYLQIGENFQAEGLIRKQRDIFYLTQTEIETAIVTEKPVAFFQLISQRKSQYKAFEQLPYYSRLVYAGEPFEKQVTTIATLEQIAAVDILQGTPCSEGIFEGEVVVITNPQAVENIENKILVTVMTDPGWVFLLAQAKGIIAEKGSLLSHTAIISRELKIPSVVGVKGATTSLKTGDIVKINGQTGVIEVIKHG